jgi:hypothetical protein
MLIPVRSFFRCVRSLWLTRERERVLRNHPRLIQQATKSLQAFRCQLSSSNSCFTSTSTSIARDQKRQSLRFGVGNVGKDCALVVDRSHGLGDARESVRDFGRGFSQKALSSSCVFEELNASDEVRISIVDVRLDAISDNPIVRMFERPSGNV